MTRAEVLDLTDKLETRKAPNPEAKHLKVLKELEGALNLFSFKKKSM